MGNNKIDVLIVDKNEDFYSFIADCIISEEREDVINLTICKDYKDIPYTNSFDIFVIGDYENNEEKVLSIIDHIRSQDQNYGSYIYVATENINSDFLKNLINKRIYGLIDKRDKDCGTLIETIEKAHKTQTYVSYIKENILKKIA